MEKLGQNNIYSQYLGQYPIVRTYKGTDLINEYKPLYTPPADWSDIRIDCPANSIALYAGHTADYSQYDNLGFTATCTGGYKVYIDGTVYGSYASGSQCTITWSSLALQTGDDITTPSALKAHKIWIEPATEGNNITAYNRARVSSSGTEYQGVLWAHFNIGTSLNISMGEGGYALNILLQAITAKNNAISILSTMEQFLASCRSLTYTPVFIAPQDVMGNTYAAFSDCQKVQKLKFKNIIKAASISLAFDRCFELLETPNFDFSNTQYATDFITYAKKLKDTILDVSAATKLKKIGCYSNSSYFMTGFKGLRVSNQAPFDGATPQINVSYTGMDRSALVQLFNDLPYNVGYEVVGSPTINNGIVSNISENNYVKTSSGFSIQDNFEIVVKLTTGSSLKNSEYIFSNIAGGAKGMAVFLNSSHGLSILGYENGDIIVKTDYNSPLSTTTTYYIKATYDGSYYKVYLSTNGQQYTEILSQESEGFTESDLPPSFGYNYTFGQEWFWGGSIDLNNTYIKINNVPFFRGQPAMTKTLSCVGATGTADLTAEDKDIALNKGWSLTLS